MDWKKLGYVFAASFIVSGLSVACALAPILSDRAEIIGFWGSIAGGMVGGAMTLAAGWLAWSAAQRQIAAQLAVLQLTTDEHLKKSVRVLKEIAMVARHIVETADRKIGKSGWPINPFGETEPFYATGWQDAINNPEFWRIDLFLADDIHTAHAALETYNKGELRIAAIFGRPRWIVADVALIRNDAMDIANRCREEARRLELMSHSATRPAEPPAR